MESIIDVATGEVKIRRGNKVLVATAIGSCVAVIIIDAKKKVGGMAHVMLPGKAPAGKTFKTRFAFNAIEALLKKIYKLGASKKNMKVLIAGGANVLRLKNCHVGRDNIQAVTKLLEENGLVITAKNVGGTERRRVKLDIDNCIVYYNKGDGKNKILWKG
ncbi:MAG: hypothetical protein A2044_02035 [Candidatus Firestonebacteria bacterium GWA2_43_8]|nr:MAG: hypothetical protein A2044_02035 [Candidatus Firestonebacteria bacterium GWA2_43_8]